MNKAILVGRLTKAPELRTTANGVSVCSFTLAVNRRFKNSDGNYEADFINCVAWRQQAEFIYKYFNKGSMVGIIGSIQTRNYDNKEGQKVYITEVAVDEVHFVGEKHTDTHNVKPEDMEKQHKVFENPGFAPEESDDLPF